MRATHDEARCERDTVLLPLLLLEVFVLPLARFHFSKAWTVQCSFDAQTAMRFHLFFFTTDRRANATRACVVFAAG